MISPQITRYQHKILELSKEITIHKRDNYIIIVKYIHSIDVPITGLFQNNTQNNEIES